MTGQKIEYIYGSKKNIFSTDEPAIAISPAGAGETKAAIRRMIKCYVRPYIPIWEKSRRKSYMCELGLTLSEIGWMEKNLKKLMENRLVKTPLLSFAAKAFQSPCPYGMCADYESMELPLSC